MVKVCGVTAALRNKNFSQKETRQRLVAESYNLLSEEDKTQKTGVGKEKGTGCYYNRGYFIIQIVSIVDNFLFFTRKKCKVSPTT